MDHPAALQRIKVGVPATVEHSSEAGPETAKWVAETTQVGGGFFMVRSSGTLEYVAHNSCVHLRAYIMHV